MIVVHYRQHTKREEVKQHFEFIMDNIVRDGYRNILIMSDHNDDYKNFAKEIQKWGCYQAEPEIVDEFYSRIDKKAGKRSWIDSIGYSRGMMKLERDEFDY